MGVDKVSKGNVPKPVAIHNNEEVWVYNDVRTVFYIHQNSDCLYPVKIISRKSQMTTENEHNVTMLVEDFATEQAVEVMVLRKGDYVKLRKVCRLV